MPRVCVFDVNETLLDLGALDPHFERVFGDASVRRSWFLQVLQSALVATVTDDYKDFGTIGAGALDMTAERMGVDVSMTPPPVASGRCIGTSTARVSRPRMLSSRTGLM